MGRIFRVHFNRIAMQRGDPKVWSVQTSKCCFHGRSVVITVPVRSEFLPDKKDNPKAFMIGYGVVSYGRDTETIYCEAR